MPRKTPHSRYLRQFISEVAGNEGIKIATCVGDGATDEKIEQKTSMKIAEVRSILNHLHSFGIVEYLREKNLSTGWFTYTWKLNSDRAIQNFLLKKKREHEGLRKKMAEEAGLMFYRCRKGCSRLPFDDAMDQRFRCPQCKSLMHFTSGRDELKKLEEKIRSLEKMTAPENSLKPPR